MKKRRIEDNYIKLRQLDLFYYLPNMVGEAQTLNVSSASRASPRAGNEDVGKGHRPPRTGNALLPDFQELSSTKTILINRSTTMTLGKRRNSTPMSSPPCLGAFSIYLY